jgi:hypothetical protein
MYPNSPKAAAPSSKATAYRRNRTTCLLVALCGLTAIGLMYVIVAALVVLGGHGVNTEGWSWLAAIMFFLVAPFCGLAIVGGLIGALINHILLRTAPVTGEEQAANALPLPQAAQTLSTQTPRSQITEFPLFLYAAAVITLLATVLLPDWGDLRNHGLIWYWIELPISIYLSFAGYLLPILVGAAGAIAEKKLKFKLSAFVLFLCSVAGVLWMFSHS